MDNKKTIEQLAGSLSFEDYDEGLVSYGNCRSCGEVWEKCVNCNHCEHKDACDLLTNEYYGMKCAQVIDYLLGQKDLETIIKEVEKDDRW